MKETNDLIDGEIAWITALENRLRIAKQSLETSRAENTRKVMEYYKALEDSAPKDSVLIHGDSVEVQVEPAE